MPLTDTSLFIIDRVGDNFKVTAKQIDDAVPAFEPKVTCVFYQLTAPYYWTQLTSNPYHHATLRLVDGAGNGVGYSGRIDFNSCFASRPFPVARHDHGINDPGHSHSVTPRNHSHAARDPGHAHSMTVPGAVHTHSRAGGSGNRVSGTNNGMNSKDVMKNNPQQLPPSNGGPCNFSRTTKSSSGLSLGTARTITSVSNQRASFTASGVKNHAVSANPQVDFAIKYIDCIVCSKN